MACVIRPCAEKWYIYGPYSSDTQNPPSEARARPSLSMGICLPPGPGPPNPSPVKVATGRIGKPGYVIDPRTSASRPVVGVPSGPVKRMVSS